MSVHVARTRRRQKLETRDPHTRKRSLSKRAMYRKKMKRKRRLMRAIHRLAKKRKKRMAKMKKVVTNVNKGPLGARVAEEFKGFDRKIKRMKNRRIRKRRLKRKKKMWVRRRRVLKHMRASRTRKMLLKEKAWKMTVDELRKLIVRLLKKRRRILARFYRRRLHICEEKRKAQRALRRAARKARHRKKKYRKYRRMLRRLPLKRKSKLKRNMAQKKKNRARAQKWKRPRKEQRKRAVYRKVYVKKITLNSMEIVSKQIHFREEEKLEFDGEAFRLRHAVIGNSGVSEARSLSKPKDEVPTDPNTYAYKCNFPKPSVDFRYQVQLTNDKCGPKMGQILAQLHRIRSKNALRVFNYGDILTLQYIMTTKSDISLADIFKKPPKMEIQHRIHLIEQTLFCLRDLHKIGYAHLQVRPSSFSINLTKPDTVVFSNFDLAQPQEDIFADNEVADDFELKVLNRGIRRSPLPLNVIDPYMSRRQHMRLNRGTADDFESWFYVCVRIMNEEPLKWEHLRSHYRMSMAKYEFPRDYRHPDPIINEKMRTIHKYALSASEEKSEKVAYFLERFIEEWKASVPPVTSFPWKATRRERPAVAKVQEKPEPE